MMFRQLTRTASLTLLTVIVSTATARASCTGLRFGLLPPIVNWTGSGSGYDVFDAVDRVQPVTFTVTKVSGTCTYFITATSELGASAVSRVMAGGSRPLTFNIFSSSTRTNPLRDLPVATANDVIPGSFASSGVATNSHVHYFWVAPGQVATPGLLTCLTHFKLFQGTLASNTLAQMVDVTYVANVRAVAEISVEDPGRPFNVSGRNHTVDFGLAHEGQKADFDVRVRGNNGFDVTIQSQNAGSMRPSGSTDPSYIPYRVTISGRVLSFAGGVAVPAASLPGATTADGIPFPVEIAVDDFSHAYAGSYSDVLTITVTPK